MRNALPVAVPSFLLFALLGSQASAQQARDWLERMSSAVEDLNYRGTFVHVLDGTPETLHIVHRNADGQSGERILSLDGARREIVREGARVLDLCTGTADLALAAIANQPDASVVGIDFSAAMLTRGLQKVRTAGLDRRIRLVRGDATGHRPQPGPAVRVVERDVRRHLGDVGRRVQPVALLERPAERRRQPLADGGLAAAGDAHHHDMLRHRAHAALRARLAPCRSPQACIASMIGPSVRP